MALGPAIGRQPRGVFFNELQRRTTAEVTARATAKRASRVGFGGPRPTCRRERCKWRGGRRDRSGRSRAGCRGKRPRHGLRVGGFVLAQSEFARVMRSSNSTVGELRLALAPTNTDASRLAPKQANWLVLATRRSAAASGENSRMAFNCAGSSGRFKYWMFLPSGLHRTEPMRPGAT